MSTEQSYSEWIWSPEHGRYYCYRYTDAGQAEYLWSDAAQSQQQQDRPPRDTPNPAIAAPPTTDSYDDGGPTSHRNHHHHNNKRDETSDHRDRAMPQQQQQQQRRDNQQQQHQAPPSSSAGAVNPGSSSSNLKRGSADDIRRFHDGDEVAMAVEERGQLVRASFVVRRGKLDRHGQWEYQLWHEDGTAYDGGAWFRETELS